MKQVTRDLPPSLVTKSVTKYNQWQIKVLDTISVFAILSESLHDLFPSFGYIPWQANTINVKCGSFKKQNVLLLFRHYISGRAWAARARWLTSRRCSPTWWCSLFWCGASLSRGRDRQGPIFWKCTNVRFLFSINEKSNSFQNIHSWG